MDVDDEIYGGRSRVAIGARIQITREVLGFQQNEFCAGADIKPSMYSQIESGRSRPSIDTALRLSDAYRITLDWIFKGDPSGLEFKLGKLIHDTIAQRTSRLDC